MNDNNQVPGIPGPAPRRHGRGAIGNNNFRAREQNVDPAAGYNPNNRHRGTDGRRHIPRREHQQYFNNQGVIRPAAERPQDFRRGPRQNQGYQNNNEHEHMRRNHNSQEGARDDGNGNRHQNRDGNRCMGYRTLEEIAHCDIQDVIAKVHEKRTSFFKLLESAIDKGDIYILIMEIISKVCRSKFDEHKLKLLFNICNSPFMVNLRNYLMDLPYTEVKIRNNLYWNNQSSFWDNFVIFCQCLIDISPSTALLKCRSLIEGTSKLCLEGLKERHGFNLADEYNAKLQQLRERLTVCEKEEKVKQDTLQRNNTKSLDDLLDPPDDFRQLSVVPTRDDLLDYQPFLRPNIVDGGYLNTEHYLDVQFRLLREDCFGPLRAGIAQFIQNPNKKKYDNIRVYENVQFIEPFISKSKIGETVQLDDKAMRKLKKINWSYSKRFIYGSLLLFTKDSCKSFITATILERDVKLLSRGKIPVSIVDKVPRDHIYNDNLSYIMIESEVYFEPYFHVLKALQDPKFPEHIAMNKYIVKVDADPNPPAYLTPETNFTVQNDYYAKTKFNVLNACTWPTKDELGFNETQYEAYKLALTHEFAVIQGPPGTGKTFLGVKVAKTLLENLSLDNDDSTCLMLVICYTNHALDQFLENILPVTQSIVRIGGQSRNEALEKINLHYLRKNRKVNFSTNRLFFEQKNNLTDAVRALQRAQERLDAINNGIISYNNMKDRLPEVQILGKYYAKYRKDVKTDPLRHWLFENMHIVDFNNASEENPEEQNIEEITRTIDETDERIEIILDDFEDDQGHDNNVNLPESYHISTSFSLNDVENKLKTMILLYNRTNNRQKQEELHREIVDLKSRINLFTEMVANRNRRIRLNINDAMDLSAVPIADRWALYFRWGNVVTSRLQRHLRPLQESLDSASTAYEEARMMVDLKMLQGIKVIGMTTSGAARLRKLLQALAPPIVIVEEAAEVLEQHIVTSLTKDCQHLILIGDHQQLRPSAAHIRLARDFNMEISLFERMITNGIHSRRLGVQHRMRPEIAELISPHIYPDLRNHHSVEHFPRVRGIADNIFFLTHDYKEKEVLDSSSKSNQPEADMTLKLANYLMQQGYEPGDVTILAAYSGQMFYMRKQRENFTFLQKVKITVVDNYQGEESKIILLSLVRNNDQNKIGFLGTNNRVCVALSRAREGFYLFGNIDILKRNSELWTKVAENLEKRGRIGTNLMLKCESHPEEITTISSPEDFHKVPEGGCLLKCNYEMPCGHACPLVCHGYDRGHNDIKCYLPCERILCERGHVCPMLCLNKCQPCKYKVKKKLPCGHMQSVDCYINPADPKVKCNTVVTVKLPKCDHEAEKVCHIKIEEVKCPVRCIYRVDKCGHECRLTCHVDDDPDHEKYFCDKPCAKAKKGCTADLVGDRGNHQCTKKCHETCEDCTVEVIKKRSKCKHSERVACNKNVDDKPCLKKCSRGMSCQHFCQKKCYEECGDCNQMVTKIIAECNHEMKLPCKTPATRDICTKKCERILSCGHPCTQLCNQICDPKNCTKLNTVKILSPCGHQVMLPCNVYNSMGEGWDPDLLLKFCTVPCQKELACEHYCKGSCGRCHQGRLHVACQEKCQRTHICGHLCDIPCNQVCPPCNKKCGLSCPHSRCNNTCGAPCMPCQERCTRRCVHGACRRRCGEPCSRPPCDEPCRLRLPCGHRCRGLCGEPCPDICNVCRPDEFPRPLGFPDDQHEDDVKFVQLQDCTHILDVESMDNMMMGDRDVVSIRTCPFCRAPVMNTHRYKDLINQTLKSEINPIKSKVYGNQKDIDEKRKELFIKILTFYEEQDDVLQENPNLNVALSELQKTVKTQKKVSLPKLETQFQYLEILDMIGEYDKKYKICRVKNFKTDYLNVVKLICTALMANLHRISQQLQQDLGNELKRMNSIIQLEKILNHPSYSKEVPKVKQTTEAARKIVLSWYKFDQDKAVIVLKEVEEAVKVSGIVTKEERDLVIKAIGSKLGSWYKCPNGHFYSIGQCGGAMEESKCADCGAAIGGRHHALRHDNAHAGELDGSPFAAFTNEYNNMANWHIDE